MMTGQVCGPIENGKKQTTINRSRTKKAKKKVHRQKKTWLRLDTVVHLIKRVKVNS